MASFQRMYPELFQPLVIRNKIVKNRVVSSPHGDPRMLEADRNGMAVFSEEAAIYYGNIARGGAAIVNTGHLGVDPRFYLGAHREYFASRCRANSRIWRTGKYRIESRRAVVHAGRRQPPYRTELSGEG